MIYNTIIIGAGMAGLTAAVRLTQQGHSVLLLEARDRLGGRIHSLTTEQGSVFEMGALYLHGRGTPENPNPLMPLFQEFNLISTPVDPLRSVIFDTNANMGTLAELIQNLDPYFNEANRLIQQAKTAHPDTFPSLAKVLLYENPPDLIPNSPLYWARKLITATITHHLGASLKDISILELMHNGGYEGGSEIVTNGYQKMIQGLFEKADATGNLSLESSRIVREIHQSFNQETVRVLTQQGKEYTAETALCAVPLGVIKKGQIKFLPNLSKEKQQAILRLKTGDQNTLILEFEKPFWPEDIHYLYPNDPDIDHWPEYINLLAFSAKTPSLLANLLADQGRFSHHTEDTLVDLALKPLRKIYGKKVSLPIRTFISHWDVDPYTFGNMAYCGTKCREKDLDNLTEPEGRLYFAGDYTQRGLPPLNSAHRSGLKAALEIEVYLSRRAQRTRPAR